MGTGACQRAGRRAGIGRAAGLQVAGEPFDLKDRPRKVEAQVDDVDLPPAFHPAMCPDHICEKVTTLGGFSLISVLPNTESAAQQTAGILPGQRLRIGGMWVIGGAIGLTRCHLR